eukprot:932134-Rhodomonas_salina.2
MGLRACDAMFDTNTASPQAGPSSPLSTDLGSNRTIAIRVLICAEASSLSSADLGSLTWTPLTLHPSTPRPTPNPIFTPLNSNPQTLTLVDFTQGNHEIVFPVSECLLLCRASGEIIYTYRNGTPRVLDGTARGSKCGPALGSWVLSQVAGGWAK